MFPSITPGPLILNDVTVPDITPEVVPVWHVVLFVHVLQNDVALCCDLYSDAVPCDLCTVISKSRILVVTRLVKKYSAFIEPEDSTPLFCLPKQHFI